MYDSPDRKPVLLSVNKIIYCKIGKQLSSDNALNNYSVDPSETYGPLTSSR